MTRPAITRLVARQYLLLLLAAVLLWPAAVNRGPLFFDDTSAYVRGPDRAAALLLGVRSEWTEGEVAGPPRGSARPGVAGGAAAADADAASKPVLLGRSPFYGLVLYLGAISTFWVALALQALIATAAVLGFLRHFVDPGRRRLFAACSAGAMLLLALTPLPFFVSFLMPDSMTGPSVLAASVLIVGWRRERPLARVAWAALALFGVLVHASHIPILLGLAGVGLLLRLRGPRTRAALAGPGAVAVIALAGLLADAGVAAAVRGLTGQPPIRPPFLLARLAADGLAAPYLEGACRTEALLICRYAERLPDRPVPEWSDGFLWDKNPRTGVFMTMNGADQRRLAAEQSGTVLGIVRYDPAAALGAAAVSAARQAGMLGLDEFNYVDSTRTALVRRLPGSVLDEVRASPAFAGRLPTGLVDSLLAPMLLAALLVIGGFAAVGRTETRDWATVVVAGWLGNAVVCGVLSTPHFRYNSRVVWIVYLLAATLIVRAFAACRERRGGEATALARG